MIVTHTQKSPKCRFSSGRRKISDLFNFWFINFNFLWTHFQSWSCHNPCENGNTSTMRTSFATRIWIPRNALLTALLNTRRWWKSRGCWQCGGGRSGLAVCQERRPRKTVHLQTIQSAFQLGKRRNGLSRHLQTNLCNFNFAHKLFCLNLQTQFLYKFQSYFFFCTHIQNFLYTQF